ncbi:hypothetical protein [Legionella qingyii]|uniref:hypothetical protein n=1 Tax=Legionella qingyii TaxID=2184757 RepID=UPI0018F36E4D|nr:hypothetical protein [Legionella qingyii]
MRYYLYKDVLYCNSTTDYEPIDPQIKNYEKLKIAFDERPWQMAWGNKNSIGTTIEYIPAGDRNDVSVQVACYLWSRFTTRTQKNIVSSSTNIRIFHKAKALQFGALRFS